MEYREVAEEAGITGWYRVPALGLEADFIDDLAEAVVEVLPRIEQPPTSDINEGRPVSLRVVNDLVQLRSKEEEIEYGPVRYEVRRTGFTPNAELINGRSTFHVTRHGEGAPYSRIECDGDAVRDCTEREELRSGV